MTTPDPSNENRAPEASGGSHSAPRPVPPIDPLAQAEPLVNAPAHTGPVYPTGSASGDAAPDPVEPAQPEPETAGAAVTTPIPSTSSAPPRVSAFGDSGWTPSPATTEPEPAPAAATSPLPTTPEVTTTQVVPAGPAQPAADTGLAGAAAGQLSSYEREPVPEPEWEIEKPAKRTAAHLWGILAIFALSPITWFLLADGAQRTFYSLQNVGDSPNLAGLLTLAGGLVGLFVIALVTRSSSLGAWIWGGLVAAAGLTFLIIPATLMQWMVDSRDAFLTVNEGFGTNLYNYLLDSGRSGLLLTFGVVLLLLAMVAHSTRRRGRTEERVKAQFEAQQ